MIKNENILAEEGMRFFSKMSASATHEIKNALAIINENAGLLGDLSYGSQDEHSVSNKRAHDISQKVTKHVKRADLVLTKLNQFSHSNDFLTQVINIEETVSFVLDLSSRLIEQKEVVFKVISPASPLIVDINLFFFENLIWNAIEAACSMAGKEKEVMVSFGKDLSTHIVWFSMSQNMGTLKEKLMDKLFESKEDKALMTYLDISIEKNIENNSFGIILPKRN